MICLAVTLFHLQVLEKSLADSICDELNLYVYAGNGIVKQKPYAKTNPTQHVGGVKHNRNP